MNDTALIITGTAAVVALAIVAALCSVVRRHIGSGGTFTLTFFTFKWTVNAPPAEVVHAYAEEPAVAAAPEWRSA
jgi:hypothetical protein